MTNRRNDCAPTGEAPIEKLYPVCRIGQTLILIGLALAFLSFVFGFWLAVLGAIFVLIGYLVITSC